MPLIYSVIFFIKTGPREKLKMSHPVSYYFPFLHCFLDMPEKELSGDLYSLKVAYKSHLSSERFVVSPGHEENGILQCPGGQCGNPLSKHYCDMQDYWLNGKRTSFLPGIAEHTLVLKP